MFPYSGQSNLNVLAESLSTFLMVLRMKVISGCSRMAIHMESIQFITRIACLDFDVHPLQEANNLESVVIRHLGVQGICAGDVSNIQIFHQDVYDIRISFDNGRGAAINIEKHLVYTRCERKKAFLESINVKFPHSRCKVKAYV